MNYDVQEIIAQENINMYMAMPAGKYRAEMRAVLEAKNSDEMTSEVINKMYLEVKSKTKGYNVDDIDDSRGNIMKVKGYDITADAIDAINRLMGDQKIDCVDLMNDLHDMILSCRSDFEHGYRYNVDMIKVIYETLVLDLYEIVDMCICAYTAMMRNPSQKDFRFKDLTDYRSKTAISQSASGFVGLYKKGDFGRLMKVLRDPKMAGSTTVEAMEGIGTGILLAAVISPLVIRSVIGFIRLAVNSFFVKAVKLDDYLNTQSEFLHTAIEAEKNLGDDPNAIAKQEKALNALERLSAFIETKILKVDKEASKQIAEDNKQYKDALPSMSVGAAADFTII